LLGAVSLNPRASERRQLEGLLSLWDREALGAFAGVGWRRFGELTQAQREHVLLAWCDSRATQRRAAFQALRKGALLFYYMLSGPYGGRNPAWDAIGYDGPLGKLAGAPPKTLKITPIDRDTILECDVAIVGSGAGGGAAAGVLAAAGLDVIVVESGGYYDDRDFDGSELSALMRFYMGAPTATHDQSVTLLAGSCLGGGTVVNYATSFRTPDEVRREWASHGVPEFISEQYTASLDSVCERLGVNRAGDARVVPYHGFSTDGRISGAGRMRSRRSDLGSSRPVRARRVRVSDRLRCQSANLNPGDRPHVRSSARLAPELSSPESRRAFTVRQL
jgi:hypothetical protein